jgi:hypothetical protein
MKIRLLEREEEDFVPWHYERSGIFMVKSASKLALRTDNEEVGKEGSSSRAVGSRSLYKFLWSAKIPPKVRIGIFAWKLSEEGLGTQDN